MQCSVWFRFTWLAATLALLSGIGLAQSSFDLEGHPVNPLTGNSKKPTVLVFLRRDCPVSGRYAPVIQQISQQYADRANFWLVYPDKTDTPDEIRRSVGEYGYKLPVLRDPEHVLVKRSRVQITPEIAVFDQNRKLVYDGRIDDWYVDLNRTRPAPTTHELQDAIAAAMAQTAMAHKEVRGVGCYISDVE